MSAIRAAKALSFVLLAMLVAGVQTVLVPPAVGAPFQEQREVRRTFTARQGATVDVENLVGEIVVEGTSGGEVEIVATINAESGSEADAQTLLGLLNIEFDESGDGIDVEVNYPVDRFDKYRYPRRRGSGESQTRYQEERVTVTGADNNDGVTLYVDIVIRVPAGVGAAVENNVGNVSATGVEGELSADTGSGDVTVSSGRGEVAADTGSGDVTVTDYNGDISADTGSGDVEISGVTGDISADTGSGSITLTDVQAQWVEADTGSGDIEFERVTGSLSGDTGSGDIVGSDLSGAENISADTGSGDIRLAGDMSQVDQIEIDTSSGDVELTMTSVPGMEITIETGSGGINVDLPGLTTTSSRRNSFRGTVGDGRAQVNIDTGSGSVRISAR